MKTAMQELIEYIESNEIVYNKDLILKLKELLEKEKEQIIEANRQGRCNDCPIMYSNQEAEQYYNQNFNQNK